MGLAGITSLVAGAKRVLCFGRTAWPSGVQVRRVAVRCYDDRQAQRSSSDGRPLIGSEPTRREAVGGKVRGGRLHCPARKIKKERFKLRGCENPAKLGDLPGHSVYFICLSLRLADAAVLPHLQLVPSRWAVREKWLSFRRSSAVYSCDQ